MIIMVILKFMRYWIEMDKELETLKKNNEEIRDSIDNCLPIDTAENDDVWKKINELVENELQQEKFCNQ